MGGARRRVVVGLAAVVLVIVGGPAVGVASTGPVPDRAVQLAVPGTRAPGGSYAWPLTPVPVVVAPFREPTHQFGPGHRGVDLAAAPGSPVLAAAAGTVAFAGVLAGRGVVSVQHGDGLRTTYEPVTPSVPAGGFVERGAVLGVLNTGHRGCPAACLHWGIRRDRITYLDPLVLLAPRRLRLLPVPDPWPDGPARGAVTPAGGPGRGPP
jgi:murein DD-endopeptidase MepM/ murein hydrolase activator NlpD